MCGIAGVYDYRGGRVETGLVDAMLSALYHRGPDDGGSWSEPNLAIGNRRLSIIDVAGGHQPTTNEDESVIVVFNGEIYNYRTLAANLRRKGHVLKSNSDTEIIAHLYEERGEDLVNELRGMFGLAVWDRRRRRLFLARDRLGIKPLYYAEVDGRLLFASEIKSLLEESALAPRLDAEALGQYISLKYVPAPLTMFEGIASLPPGHALTCDASGYRVRRWWKLPLADQPVGAIDEDEAAAHLCALLRDSVQAHLVSDVPFGAFLSGGVDSSTIVALMSQHLHQPVKTFSIGYDGDAASISELPYARLVVDRYATDHHELIVTADDFITHSQDIAWHLDQPIADEACLPTYLLSRLASRHVKMVLTGEGGDELFAGYARHSGERLSPLARAVPRPLRELAVSGSRLVPGQRRAKLALNALAQADEAQRFQSWFCLFNEAQKRALLNERSARRLADLPTPADTFRSHLRDTKARDPLSRMLYLDTTLWLPDDLLARGDKMSMASSLEARVPLLDHALVEFAAGLPSHLKLRGRTRKYLLRKVAAAWLPEPILTRKKQGFPTPVSMWFRGPARTFLRDHLSAETLAKRDLFDPSFVDRLLREHEQGVADHGSLLFGLLNLELWQKAYVDGDRRQGHSRSLPGPSASTRSVA